MGKLLLLLAMLPLSACGIGAFGQGFGSFHPAFMNTEQPGPPEYQAGWKDGCQSGLATYGGVFNKLDASFYQNTSMLKDPNYDVAWHESFNYCRHYNYKWYTQDN